MNSATFRLPHQGVRVVGAVFHLLPGASAPAIRTIEGAAERRDLDGIHGAAVALAESCKTEGSRPIRVERQQAAVTILLPYAILSFLELEGALLFTIRSTPERAPQACAEELFRLWCTVAGSFQLPDDAVVSAVQYAAAKLLSWRESERCRSSS